MSKTNAPERGETCLLAQTGVYEEYLSIRPIEALPGSHDLLIQSRLESARDPQALQARYRAGLSLGALERLHAFLGDYLARHREGSKRDRQEVQS